MKNIKLKERQKAICSFKFIVLSPLLSIGTKPRRNSNDCLDCVTYNVGQYKATCP